MLTRICCVAEVSLEGKVASATLAAVLRCLADAPALPALAWALVCHSLCTPTTARDNTSFGPASSHPLAANAAALLGDVGEVHAAALMLALKHGNMTSHGLGSFLDQLFAEARFPQLPFRLQHMLLIGLPEVLQSVSTQRSIALLSTARSLCSLPSDSNLNSEPRFELHQPPRRTSNSLSTALCLGLARCLHSAQRAEQQSLSWPAAVIQAAHAAVRDLLPQLPLPPVLLPAEQLPCPIQDLSSALSTDMTDVESETQQIRQQDSAVVWGAACACLKLMPQSKVSVFTTCLLCATCLGTGPDYN